MVGIDVIALCVVGALFLAVVVEAIRFEVWYHNHRKMKF